MSSNHLIFLDTEFTSFESPELISLGLAASTGEDFYAEVPFSTTSVSPFVHEVVIPLLKQNSADYCKFDELHVRILNWLTVVRTGVEIVLCFDSQYDEILFRTIFDGYPPQFLRFRNVDRNINEFLRHEFHVKNMLPEHHALNDAMAMRYAFRESLHRPTSP
nr:3'-5' exoribonuclease [Massilia sp. Bi118]